MRNKVVFLGETVEKVDLVGRDSSDAKSRRPYGRSAAFEAVAETNVLAGNAPLDPGSDFFSSLRRNRASRQRRIRARAQAAVSA